MNRPGGRAFIIRRPPKLTAHHLREEIKRRDLDGESLADNAQDGQANLIQAGIKPRLAVRATRSPLSSSTR
jgi:hypothetical protein